MPISRYLDWLDDSGQLPGYMQVLVECIQPVRRYPVMCRSLVSVGWDGRVFDCDFNQMLDLEARGALDPGYAPELV